MEKKELDDLVKAVPQPENVALFDGLTPRVICQQFRYNTPVRSTTLTASQSAISLEQLEVPACIHDCLQLHHDNGECVGVSASLFPCSR